MKTRFSVVKHRVTRYCGPRCHNPRKLWTLWADWAGNGDVSLISTHSSQAGALAAALDYARLTSEHQADAEWARWEHANRID